MKNFFAFAVFGFLMSVFFLSCASGFASPRKFSGATPLEWSKRLADSEIARRDDSLVWKAGGKAKWDYTVGLFTLSLLKLSDALVGHASSLSNSENNNLTGKMPVPLYENFSEKVIGSFISPDGKIQTYKPAEFQLDSLNSGKTVLALWQITGDAKYKDAATILRRQLNTQPRTFDGGFWHKEHYTNQMWLDGIYMGDVFYAEYAKLFDKPNDFDDVAKQFRLIDEHCYDAKTGLYFHGRDAAKVQPWANPQTGCSSNFWGRAIGWYAMALVDTLDFLPTNHPARAELVSTFQKLCASIVKFQDRKTGLWWQVMDQKNRKGNYLEATASAMFVYALAKGVNKNYLAKNYSVLAEKGFGGIVKNLIVDDGKNSWSLTNCCSVAGLGFTNSKGRARDGSFDYYVGEPIVENDLKGIAPFILAGIELQKLLDGK